MITQRHLSSKHKFAQLAQNNKKNLPEVLHQLEGM